MRSEENGQIKLFTLIEVAENNPLYPRTIAREQLAYQRAIVAGAMATKEVVSLETNEVEDEVKSADN